MATTVNLKKLLHRKAWETCTSAPVATTAGGFIVSDKYDVVNSGHIMMMTSAAAVYLYEADADGWTALPTSGATGTFGAGSCGEYRLLGAMGGAFTQTATAGSTTTITTNRTIVRSLAGKRIRVIAGAGLGYDDTIASNTLGTNAVITVTTPSGVAFDATTQFQVLSGSLWFFNAGAGAVGFSVYDIATNAWNGRSVTGLPTTWNTTGQLVSTIGLAGSFATGLATAGGATTLTNGLKSWATNMFANFQVRITGGTGKGQIRPIASNTGTVLTVSTAWAVNPDATSTYSIEGNGDVFYLLGNNAVTMYKYTVSTNTWATLAPVAARAGAMAGGGTADWVDNVVGWDNETQVAHYSKTLYKQNGRYIYSFRGGATSTLDVYDIAANTWISGVAYGYQQETFTTGSSSCDMNGIIYLMKEATGRTFAFDVAKHIIEPFTTNTAQVQLGGTAVDGDKIALVPYVDGATKINYVYQIRHSGADFVRMMVI